MTGLAVAIVLMVVVGGILGCFYLFGRLVGAGLRHGGRAWRDEPDWSRRMAPPRRDKDHMEWPPPRLPSRLYDQDDER